MTALALTPPAAAIVSTSGFGSGLPTPNVSWPQMKAKRSATPSFASRSWAERLDLVGADGLAPAGARDRVERRRDAGIEPRVLGDMGVVMGEEVAEQRLERHRRRASGPTAAKPRSISARPPAPSSGRGVGDRQGREALADQDEVQRPHQVGRGVGERAVEIEDDGRRRSSARLKFQKSGSARR